MNVITSSANSRVKHAVTVREGKVTGLAFVEGERLVEDLFGSSWAVETLFHTEEPSGRTRALIQQGDARGAEVVCVSETVLKSMADTVNPQGVIALARPAAAPVLGDCITGGSLVVVLDGVQDPGNVGTILRSAEGAGAACAVVLRGSAQPLSSKVLRAAMGSAFRLPIIKGLDAAGFIRLATEYSLPILASAAGTGAVSYADLDWTQRCALILGNEANGVSALLMEQATARVRIPLLGQVESLNVAAAAAVLLFEAARQRA